MDIYLPLISPGNAQTIVISVNTALLRFLGRNISHQVRSHHFLMVISYFVHLPDWTFTVTTECLIVRSYRADLAGVSQCRYYHVSNLRPRMSLSLHPTQAPCFNGSGEKNLWKLSAAAELSSASARLWFPPKPRCRLGSAEQSRFPPRRQVNCLCRALELNEKYVRSNPDLEEPHNRARGKQPLWRKAHSRLKWTKTRRQPVQNQHADVAMGSMQL